VDDWRTVHTKESATVGYAGHFADLETEAGKAGKVIFTLRWRMNDRWEGRNFEVLLEPV
jgi:glucoamylase